MIPCPICQKENFISILPKFELYSSSITREDNINFSLSLCTICNHYFNSSFDPDIIDYSNVEFETFFNHSSFKSSVKRICENIITYSNNEDLQIFDFGCGDGEFLKEFKAFSKKKNRSCTALGFEVGKCAKIEDNVTFDIEYFKSKISEAMFPIVTARHVLEHLSSLNEFFSCVSDSSNALLYLEVPNGAEALMNNKYEDLVYEHVSYFSTMSLQAACEAHGWYAIANVTSLCGENIGVIASKSSTLPAGKLDSLAVEFTEFETDILNLTPYLRSPKTVFWGVGGRCRAVLERARRHTACDLNCQLVDSDETKCGKVFRGYSSRVISPSAISWDGVERIIIGTRVGYSSILQELRILGVSKPVLHWSELI